MQSLNVFDKDDATGSEQEATSESLIMAFTIIHCSLYFRSPFILVKKYWLCHMCGPLYTGVFHNVIPRALATGTKYGHFLHDVIMLVPSRLVLWTSIQYIFQAEIL